MEGNPLEKRPQGVEGIGQEIEQAEAALQSNVATIETSLAEVGATADRERIGALVTDALRNLASKVDPEYAAALAMPIAGSAFGQAGLGAGIFAGALTAMSRWRRGLVPEHGSSPYA